MTRRRGEVDWSWARYAVGRAAEAPSAPESAPEPAPSLADEKGAIELRRPRWHWWLLAASFPASWAMPEVVRRLRDRVRVAWDDDVIVVARSLDRSARRIARVGVASIRRDASTLALVLVEGELVPLVIARKVRAGDVAQARALASALRLPFVDDSGARPDLPAARVRRPTPSASCT